MYELDTAMATEYADGRAVPGRGTPTDDEYYEEDPDWSHAPPSGKRRRKGAAKGRSRESERSSRHRSGETEETAEWEHASSLLESAPSSAEGPQRFSRVRKKWRGGPPPPAPPLHATYDNVYKVPKMYTKWCRQIDAWKLRVRHYKPFAEATLDLVDAITGDGALILEKVPLSELHTPGGVDKVVEMMKVFDEVALLSIGNILESWETVRRTEGVTLSKFIGDFLDLERECKQKGLEVQSGDARAFKFLRACTMTPDHQRQLLVESRGYDFDRLCAAMRTQWPRVAPPIGRAEQRQPFHHRSAQRETGKGFGTDRQRYPSSASSVSSSRPSGSRVFEAAAQDEVHDSVWLDTAWYSDSWTVPEDTVWQAESQYTSWICDGEWQETAWQDQGWQPDSETAAPADDTVWQAESPDAARTDAAWSEAWQPEAENHVLEAVLSEIAECYSVTATKLKGITLGRACDEKGGSKSKGKGGKNKGGKNKGKSRSKGTDKGKGKSSSMSFPPSVVSGQLHSSSPPNGKGKDAGKFSRGVGVSSAYVADIPAKHEVSETAPKTLPELIASGSGPATRRESHETLVAASQLIDRAGRTRDEEQTKSKRRGSEEQTKSKRRANEEQTKSKRRRRLFMKKTL